MSDPDRVDPAGVAETVRAVERRPNRLGLVVEADRFLACQPDAFELRQSQQRVEEVRLRLERRGVLLLGVGALFTRFEHLGLPVPERAASLF